MSGWIKLHRSLCHSEMWTSETFSRGQAWVDLLMLASHKDTSFFKRGILVEQGRGQVAISIKGLADRWRWSRNRVKKFLNDLKTIQQIEHQNTNVTTLITLVNYEKYQEKKTPNGAPSEAPSRTPSRTPTEPQSRSKEYKEEKNNNGTKFNAIKFRPDFISVEDWKDLVEHRRKTKAANTKRAYTTIVNELKKAKENGFSPKTCIDQMSNRSWKGFFAEWMKEEDKDGGGGDNLTEEQKRKLSEINTILKQRENAPPALLDKYAIGKGYNSYNELFSDLSREKQSILGKA